MIINNKKMDTNILNLPLDERRETISKLIEKNREGLPVIFRFNPNSNLRTKITNPRLFLPKKQRVIDVIKNIRRQFCLTSEAGLSFSTNDTILPANMIVEEAYNKYASDDHILYLKINEISPFG